MRQGIHQESTYVLGPDDAPRDRNDVRRQPAFPLVVPEHVNHRFLQIRMGAQGCLDLLRLDPEPSNLCLRILATQVLERPVRTLAPHVSGQIDPMLASARIGQKDCSRQIRVLPVSRREIRAAYAELSDLTGFRPLAALVYHEYVRARQRNAHRNDS